MMQAVGGAMKVVKCEVRRGHMKVLEPVLQAAEQPARLSLPFNGAAPTSLLFQPPKEAPSPAEVVGSRMLAEHPVHSGTGQEFTENPGNQPSRAFEVSS